MVHSAKKSGLIGEEQYVKAPMYTCIIIFRHGHEMCRNIGSTKRQAERNAAIMGLKYIDDNYAELYAQTMGTQKDNHLVSATTFTKFDKIDIINSNQDAQNKMR